MLKNTDKRKYFIIGTILLFIALFCITALPFIIKKIYKPLPNNFYSVLEFLFLCGSSLFYCFSHKYYKYQIISILYAILIYFIFVRLYTFTG